MNKLDNLLKELSQDELVVRFKELEKNIDNDHVLQKEYSQLLELQKVMIKKREKQSKDLNKAIKDYETAKENVLNHFVLNEYLNLLEEVNYDLGLIQKIISEEISIDFE